MLEGEARYLEVRAETDKWTMNGLERCEFKRLLVLCCELSCLMVGKAVAIVFASKEVVGKNVD